MKDLIDYVLKLHIITGPNGQCMCGEEGITCADRLARTSHDIWAALHMAQSGGERVTISERSENRE